MAERLRTETGASALGLVLRTQAIVLPGVLALMLFAGAPQVQLLVMAAMVAWGFAALLLYRAGRQYASVVSLVYGLIVFAGLFSATYGSVRGTGTALTVAGVAAGGVFLERRALIVAGVLASLIVVALIVAERAGAIAPPTNYPVGLLHALSFLVLFACVGLGAGYARHLLLDALEKSSRGAERFEKMFEIVPVPLALARVDDGRLLAVNAADAAHLGYRRDDALGRSTLQTAWIDPEDRRRFLRVLERDGSVAGFEARHHNAAGEPIDVQLWAVRVEVDGVPCVLSASINVTQRRREEQLILETAAGVAGETGERLFRSLVGHLAATMGCPIALCGEIVGPGQVRALAMLKDGELTADNRVAIGGTPCAALAGDGRLCVQPSGVAERFPEALAAIDPRVRSHVGVLLRDALGEPIGVLCAYGYEPWAPSPRMEALFRIFAARAEAELRTMHRERELQQLQASLEQRVRERTADLESFSYSVSHDLRAPLRSLSGMSSILRRDFAGAMPEPAVRYLDRIEAAASQMGRLVDGLLEFARLGLEAMNPRPVDMRSLAETVARELAAAVAAAKRPAVRFEIGELPPTFGEERLLLVVWRNLLGNAVKYSRNAAQPFIRVQASQDPGGVRYAVSDNGAGFDPRYADKLFKVFERLHPASEFEGTGIGLAIVARIVRRHGGTVEAQSLPGGGACFAFTLPGDRRSDPSARR